VNTFISTAKKDKLWIDNYDKYVEAVQKDNERMQDEYDKQVGEFDTEKAELKEKEIRLNSHPYQLAISIVTDLIPDWQDVVNKIAQLLPKIEENNMGEAEDEKWDPLLKEAARLVVIHQQGSTSLIQRHFSIGYNRAGRIMDQLEKINIVSAAIYSKPREVLAVDEEDLNYRFKEFNL
jgi:DNA segregation ATPase FtsK/SpoIIIE-like protein